MVQVNSEKVAKAIESAMNGVQFQSWQYFTIGEESVYCLDLIEARAVKDEYKGKKILARLF